MRKKTIQVRVPLNIIDDLVTIVEKKVGQPPLQKLPPSMIRVQKPATTSNLISTKENFVNSTPSNPSVKNTSGEAIKVEQLPERRALKDVRVCCFVADQLLILLCRLHSRQKSFTISTSLLHRPSPIVQLPILPSFSPTLPLPSLQLPHIIFLKYSPVLEMVVC